MSDPKPDDTTVTPDRSETAPKLRFVTARPDTQQGRREARAAIRAHASQASWAKIRKHGRQARREPTQPEEQPLSSAGEPASTDLVSSSNDVPYTGSSGEASASAVRQTILGSLGVPSPLRTVGAGDVDPFTSYPSRLPKEVATLIIDQGKPGTAPTRRVAACKRSAPTCVRGY